MKVKNEILRQQLKERVGEVAGLLGILVLGVASSYMFAREKSNVVMVVVDVLIAVILIMGAGLCFWAAFMGRISQAATFTLFGGRKFLKKAPFPLSRIQGNIAKGHFDEAERELLPLAEEYPGDAHVVRVLVELYLESMKRPEAAHAALRRYFETAVREGGEENWLNLLDLADLEIRAGNRKLAAALFHAEMRRPIYCKREKELIALRLSALKRESEMQP